MSVQEVLDNKRRWHVEAADAAGWLATLPAGCAQVCVTSPPYWALRSYLKKDHPLKHLELGSEATPEEYVANLVRVFREVRRVLADHGTLWVNVGDSYAADSKGSGGRSSSGLNAKRDESGTLNGKAHITREPTRINHGLKPLDQCCIPHRLYLALIADGWYGRSDCVWAKLSAMPSSVRGWRWEKCRVKVKTAERGRGAKVGHEGHGSNHRKVASFKDERSESGKMLSAEERTSWSDCPGCKKCLPHGGLVLRKGSWRPTSAHEYIFLLAKSSSYFCDGDAVRTPLSPVTLARDRYSRILDDPDEQFAVAHDHETPSNPGGANLRDVIRLDSTAEDVFRWLCEQDPALGEALYARWREGQGLHDVLRVGPEPLKARHYAAFPTRLVEPLLKASTSERGQCPACGMPWVRVVTRGDPDESRTQTRRAVELAAKRGLTGAHIEAIRAAGTSDCGRAQATQSGTGKNTAEVLRLADEAKEALGGYYREFLLTKDKTTGWRPSCACGPVPPNERSGGLTAQHGLDRTGMSHFGYNEWLKDNPTRTVGWQASCECAGEPIPQLVLDPFAGSGRTGMAARRLGLRFLGCDLNPSFADLANRQIAADALDVPMAADDTGPSLFDNLEDD